MKIKAVIPNSGIGRRMEELTENKPKCLVELGNKDTILGYQIKQLLKNGIKNVLITTGPFEEQIKELENQLNIIIYVR